MRPPTPRRLLAAAATAAAVATTALPAAAQSASGPVRYPSAPAVPALDTATTAFVNVSVLPMDRERVLRDQTVLVRAGRITAVGAANGVTVPAGARRVDGRGKFLMPGFAEMHGHVPAQAGPVSERVLALYILGGVTTVRGMQGHANQLQFRERIRRGELLGPTLVLSGPAISGGNTPTPTAGAQKVRDQKAAGFDLLKIHEGLSRETYDSIAAVARQLGMPYGGHIPDAVGVRGALELRQGTVDHMDNYAEALDSASYPGADDAAKIAGMVAATKAAGAAIVPTMPLWEVLWGARDIDSLAARPENRYMPAQTVEQWRTQATNLKQQRSGEGTRRYIARRMALLRAMRDGGVPILFGTDAPQIFSVPGFSVRREIETMKQAGLTNWEILVSGTRAPAEHFGRAAEFGTVATGRRADLLLLDGNPLEDLQNFSRLSGVMVGGRWLDRGEIERRLGEMVQ